MLKNTCYLFCLAFFFSCSDGKSTETTTQTTTSPLTKSQAEADAVIVSAFLIFDDGTESKTDLLNTKDVVLYNTVTGGGTAKKPAHSVKLVITGNLEGLYAQIEEYGHNAFNEKFPAKSRVHEITMKDIGCKSIYFAVRDENTVIYENVLPFGCGE